MFISITLFYEKAKISEEKMQKTEKSTRNKD